MQYESMMIFHSDDYDMNHYPRDIGLKQNASYLVDTQFVRSHQQKYIHYLFYNILGAQALLKKNFIMYLTHVNAPHLTIFTTL